MSKCRPAPVRNTLGPVLLSRHVGDAMPLFTLARLLFTLVSLAVLGGAGYFLWTWYEEDPNYAGAPDREREAWRLWTAITLFAWSFLGRFIVLPLLARRDGAERKFERGQGQTITGTDGVPLYVEMDADRSKPTLVFTHGQALESSVWTYARRDLEGAFRLVCWDLPGLGRSKPAGRRTLDVTSAAKNLRSVVTAAGADRVVLVGHSFGGMAVQELAQLDPGFFERNVAGVVLLNTTFTNPLRTMILSKLALLLQKPVLEPLSRLTAWIEPMAWLSNWQSYLSGFAHLATRIQFNGQVTQRQLDYTALLATRNRPGAVELRNVAMYQWRGLERPAIRAPTLVVGGGKDIVTKFGASKQLAADLPAAKLLAVDGANHMGFLEQASEYNEAIGEFAQQVFSTEPATTT
jgi:pimeloyl-ACP methyl ester carboxylesterase